MGGAGHPALDPCILLLALQCRTSLCHFALTRVCFGLRLDRLLIGTVLPSSFGDAITINSTKQ